MRRWPFVLLLSVFLFKGQAISQQATAAKALHDLFTAAWDYDMQQRPDNASEQGDRRWNDRWEDTTLAAIEQNRSRSLEPASNRPGT